jgi:hypothetical protein
MFLILTINNILYQVYRFQLANRSSNKFLKESNMFRSTSHNNFLKKNDKLSFTPRISREPSRDQSNTPNKFKSNLTNIIKIASFNFPYQINESKHNLPNILKK